MPNPASFLDAVVSTLQTELAAHSVNAAAIRAHDWDFEGGEPRVTVGDPFVLVMPKGIAVDDQLTTPRGDLTMVAFCGARAQRSKDADLTALDSRGDVAAFLAAEVARLAKTQTWGGASVVCGYAHSIRCANVHTVKLKNQGMSMWVTAWVQPVELGSGAGAILGPISGVQDIVATEDGTENTVPITNMTTF